jgi:hypothetical protein
MSARSRCVRGCVAQADAGMRSEVLSTAGRERLRMLERENRELRRANEILEAAGVRRGA